MRVYRWRAIARAVQDPLQRLCASSCTRRSPTAGCSSSPCDDWPPGCPKDQRALQISRMVRENREALHLVAMQLFCLTPSGARVLVKLLENDHVSREALHIALSRTTDPASDIKIVDVAICSMRKRLEKFGIEIMTLWAYGFQLSSEHRRRAMDLILSCRGAPG